VKNFSILLKRELRAVGREKTIMFAIMIQFVIASLSSILLVGIMAFYDPSSISQNTNASIRVGLVQPAYSPMKNFMSQKGIRVTNYPDLAAAKAAFEAGGVDAVMQIPEARSGVVDMQLILPKLDTSQTVVLMMLQDPLKKYENYLREANGIEVKYADLLGKSSNSYEFLYTIIIPILMLFPALIAGSIIIDTISEEFENKTFETLLATPVSLAQIFGAKIAAAVATAIGQVILWVILLRMNGTVIANPIWVIMIALVAAAMIAFIAALVALFFKDRERSQFIYSMVLVVVVAGSAFVGFSPLSLITNLANGAGHYNYPVIILYPVALAVLGLFFFMFSKKLVLHKR
jgi:ABC-2 type transport system permease protein